MKKILFLRIPKRILLIILVGVIVIFLTMLTSLQEITQATERLYQKEAESALVRQVYANTKIQAATAIVYDATNNTILFSKNSFKRQPLASITKIMTALVGATILPSTTPITITEQARTDEPDFALRTGDTWKAQDLLKYSLIKSSNDGMNAVCQEVDTVVQKTNQNTNCITLMNQYAQNHQLPSLYFSNPSGLDLREGVPSSYGSALDVAKMLAGAYTTHPSLFKATSEPIVAFKTKQYTYQAFNTNKIIDQIDTLLAGKTGYTNAAGGNLAVLYEPEENRNIVIVVLGSSRDDRFDDMLELIKKTNQYLSLFERHYSNL